MSEKVPPDLTFVRDGMPLAEWLWRLVAEDRPTRHAAGEALQAMSQGVPSVHTDLTTLDWQPSVMGQGERFAQAVRNAVAGPAFDAAEFVRRLCAFKLALKRDWSRRVDVSMARSKAQDDRFDRLAEPTVERINAATDEATREQALRRFARISAAYICGSVRGIGGPDDPYRDAESTAPSGFAAYLVFQALGPELLAAPEAIEALLDDRQLSGDALGAIERAGPAGIAFAPRLLADLDAVSSKRDAYTGYAGFDGAAALGAIGRDDPATVDALIARLDHADKFVRAGAAAALEAMDGALAGRNAEAVARLMARRDELSIAALASVGRDDPEVRALVADQLRARPPRMAKFDGYDAEYDVVMYERGTAINATRHLTAYPDEFVPLLIDAIETFEEYDPDEGYNGPCQRVARALARFGAAAGEAAVPLARKLGPNEDGEFPRAVVDALAAIGPAAREALPFLDAYRREQADEDVPLVDVYGNDPIDAVDDPVGCAMRRIAVGAG